MNCADSKLRMIDITYEEASKTPMKLSLRYSSKVTHSLLPLKCCYSPSGNGFLISGSEDKEIYIYPLPMQHRESIVETYNLSGTYLRHHEVPVVAVTVNKQNTLLVSADSLGKIVFWRRSFR